MKKRVLSFVLVLTAMLGAFSTFAFAEASGKCGDGAYWEYDEATATLTISGTGKIDTSNAEIEWANNAPWQDEIKSIKTVVINEGITQIGAGAFRNCTALESVDMPDSLTEIGFQAFYNCTSLTNVTIPENVKRINSSFVGCTNLKTVNIPGSVEEISNAFEGCESIERVYISDISEWCNTYFGGTPLAYGADLYVNGAPVTDAVITDGLPQANGTTVICQYTFYNCKSLESVTVSGNIDWICTKAFSNCTSLETVSIENGTSVIGINAFYNCTSLKNVTVPDSVTDIHKGAFANCSDLRKMKLPSQLTEITEEMFSNSSIRVLYIPASVTTVSVDAFKNTDISYVYYGGSEADRQNITVSSGNSSLDSAVWVYNAAELPDHTYDGYVCNKCGEVTADTSKIFTDVKPEAWYKKYADYTYAYGIFNGTSETAFSPNMAVSRAQFVQVLANLEGVDTSSRNVTTKFSDVPSGKWYTPAVKWASENGVVNGIGNGKFDPNANVTREQMCMMLVNYAKFKGITIKAVESKVSFADDAKISKWAKDAVYICQQADIVNGKDEGAFDPQGTGSRAEAATIFTAFHKNYLS